MPEHFWIESAPGYVRLRHEVGLQSRMRSASSLGDGRWAEVLAAAQAQGLISLEVTLDEGPLEVDDDEFYDARAEEEAYWNELGEVLWLASLHPVERQMLEEGTLSGAEKAAAERAGRGAGGISPRSRSEMWRQVLSLPFDMLGDRPLWITLTYPRDWRRRVPDGRTFEAHRRSFRSTPLQQFPPSAKGLSAFDGCCST